MTMICLGCLTAAMIVVSAPQMIIKLRLQMVELEVAWCLIDDIAVGISIYIQTKRVKDQE
jgi:hypothetical protein